MNTIGDLPGPQSRQVHLGGTPVQLTRTEFDLLDALSTGGDTSRTGL